MLPPDFPGYQGYCPYTTGAEDGAWHGPDMAKALRLVRESGTTNVPVTVWSFNDGLGKAVGSYLVGAPRRSGIPGQPARGLQRQFFADLDDPRLKIQVSIGAGWGADFPAPSTFFGPLLSCQSADEPGTNNWARFCDPHVDALASQAQAAQLTDPAAARRLWAQADRIVTDQAPYVPVFNAGTGRIRLLPGRELPGIPGVRTPARPDVGPIRLARTRSMPRARVSRRAVGVSPDG